MTSKELKNLIEQHKKLYAEYKWNVIKFEDFLRNEKDVTDNNIVGYHKGMTTECVLECLKYWIDSGAFRTKNKAIHFMDSIKSLYSYLLSSGFESDFGDKIRDKYKGPSEYREKLLEYINSTEAGLADPNDIEPLPDDAALILIQACDRLIDARIHYTKGSEPKIFGQCSSSLCIKLMLYCGCSYRYARTIKRKAFNSDNGQLTINNIKIILPFRLANQLSAYISICQNKPETSDNPILFLGKNGLQWGVNTSDSGITTVLANAIERSSIQEISRKAIQELYKNGMLEHYIRRLTGFITDESSKKQKVPDFIVASFESLISEMDESDEFNLVNSALVKHSLFSLL